jgi:hypothetical protein
MVGLLLQISLYLVSKFKNNILAENHSIIHVCAKPRLADVDEFIKILLEVIILESTGL